MEFNDSLLGNDQVNIDFQGIELNAIHGTGGLAMPDHFAALEEHEVPTGLGLPIRVYVQRGERATKNSIVTFHDIGTNHRSFLGFFNYPATRVILEHFTVYHICAPGHHDTAGPVASEVIVSSTGANSTVEQQGLLSGDAARRGGAADQEDRSDRSGGGAGIYTIYGQGKSTTPSYPTLDELSTTVGCVARHFGLACFVGVGSGAGANVLCRYALRDSSRLLCLLLLNPTAHSDVGYFTWLFGGGGVGASEWQRMRQGIVTEAAQRLLQRQWFGHLDTDNVDLLQAYRQHLLTLCLPNVAGYAQSYFQRDDLGIQRPGEGGDARSSRSLDVSTLLITGAESAEQAKALVAMNARCDPSKTEFLVVDDADGMLMEERPDKLVNYLLGLLRENGLVAYLTPGRLKELAIRRRAESAVVEGAVANAGVC